MNIRFLILVLIGLFVCPAQAQNSIPYQRLLLLVAGPSGDRISPDEQAVVSYLNQMRGRYNFSQLQMGTMHFDRPSESQLLQNRLGYSPSGGVTVGLVQLSEQGMPMRTLYKMENVTPQSLEANRQDLLQRWSEYSGERLPTGLRQEIASRPSPPPSSPPPTHQPDPWVTSTQPQVEEPPGEILSQEGIRAVIGQLRTRTENLWLELKDAPIRDDGNDIEVRRQTLGLAEASLNLHQANEKGIIYPEQQLRQVTSAGRAWLATEPQYFLPVPLRQEVEPLSRLLKQVRDIERQAPRS